jgi:predicted enzyme related to lactoylglutathione lyase
MNTNIMQTTYKSRLTALLAGAALLSLGLANPANASSFPALNSPASSEHNPGKLVWADLFTSDPDAASKFYCGLLGWTAENIDQKGSEYTIFSNKGVPVAGLSPHSKGKEGMSSKWIGYVSVTDIKATVDLVEKNGGTVHAKPKKFKERGHQAIITDGEGVAIGLLQSSSGDAPDDDTVAGGWNWFELYAKDPVASSNFFHTALGYDAAPETRSGRRSEFVLASGGVSRAGIAPLPDGENVSASWLGIIRVADIDDMLSRVAGLGGQVLVPPHAVEFGSRFAIVSDPTGGAIGLVQYTKDENPAKSP